MIWSKRLEVALWLVLRNQLPLDMPDRDTVAYGSLDNLLLEGDEGVVAWDYNADEMLKAKKAWNEIKLRIMADKDREEVNGQNSAV